MNSVTPINISGKTPEAGLQKHAAKKSHSKTHPAFRRNEDDILIEDDAVAAATSLSTTSSTTAATEPRWPHTTTGTGEMNSDSEQFIVNKAPTTATASAPRTENIQIIDIKLLKPNPLNFTLYGEEPVDEELMSSIKEYGIQEPLICTSDYIQISGHRRLKASRALCLTEVPVKVVDARQIQRTLNNKEEEVLRLLFEITSLLHPTKTYVAQKIYRRGDSTAIIEDFDHLLGGKIERVINLSGEIIPEALSLFVGMEVDIEIEHHRGKNHDEPFCLVTQVKNRGVLIELMKEAA